MKNLTKKLSTIITMLPILVLLLSVFSQKALGQNIPSCSVYGQGQSLNCDALEDGSKECKDVYPTETTKCLHEGSGFDGFFFTKKAVIDNATGKRIVCCNVVLTPTPTPTNAPTPTLTPTNTPIPTNTPTPTPQPVLRWQQSYFACTVAPTSTPTPTPTPSRTCGPSDCSSICAPGFECSQKSDVSIKSCECQLIKTPTPTPTSALTPNFNCGDKNCNADQTCIAIYFNDNSPYCLPKNTGKNGSFCGTLNKTPNNDACSSKYCDSSLLCAVAPTPTAAPNLFTCGNQVGSTYGGNYQCATITNTESQCPQGYDTYSPPKPPFTGIDCNNDNKDDSNTQNCCKQIAPTPTPNPNAISINLFTGTNFISLPVISADKRITALIPVSLESKIETISYYDGATGTWNAYIPGPAADNLSTLESGKGYLFQMKEAATLTVSGAPYEFQSINLAANKWYTIGTPATAVKVSDVIGTCDPSTLQLKTVNIDGSQSVINLTADTLLESKKGYWINSPATCTLSKTVAPTVNKTILILNLNVQDVTITGDLAPDIFIYNFKDKSFVTQKPALPFTKSSFQGIQYTTNMPITDLPQGKYLIVTREHIGNALMTAKSSFTVSGANQTISVDPKTLVFGDLNIDNDITVSDWSNIFRTCWANGTVSDPGCRIADFDNNNKVDQVDFGTFLKGWGTWKKETKDL